MVTAASPKQVMVASGAQTGGRAGKIDMQVLTIDTAAALPALAAALGVVH